MTVKPLPPHPNLAHLKSEAKDLRRRRASRDPQVAQRIREFHPRFQGVPDASIFDARFRLSDVRSVLAESGYCFHGDVGGHDGCDDAASSSPAAPELSS